MLLFLKAGGEILGHMRSEDNGLPPQEAGE